MNPISCCRYCEERKLGCHDTCEKYIKEKQEYKVFKHEIRNQTVIDRHALSRKCVLKNQQLKKYGRSYR